MKKLFTLLLAAMMLLTAMTVLSEEETKMNWAYVAMPLNNGNVGTIYYTAAYYEVEGIRKMVSSNSKWMVLCESSFLPSDMEQSLNELMQRRAERIA